MTYYCTKYALTQGIIQFAEDAKAEVVLIKNRQYLSVKGPWGGFFLREGEWYTDLKLAQVHAEVLRNRKIQALQKQINKLVRTSIPVITP